MRSRNICFALVLSALVLPAFSAVAGVQSGGAVQNDLLGADADENGIRDDIDRYIDRTFTKPEERSAARQLASALQATLRDAEDKEKSLKNGTRLSAAVDCVASLQEDVSTPQMDRIESLTMNTKARTKAYLRFSKQISGGYFPGQVGNAFAEACEH